MLLQAIEAEETVLQRQLRGSSGKGGSFEQDIKIWLRC